MFSKLKDTLRSVSSQNKVLSMENHLVSDRKQRVELTIEKIIMFSTTTTVTKKKEQKNLISTPFFNK